MKYNTNFISICRKAIYGKRVEEIQGILTELFNKARSKFDYCFLMGLCDYYNTEFGVDVPEIYHKFSSMNIGKLCYPEYMDTRKMPGNVIKETVDKANLYFRRWGILFEYNGNFYDNK